MQNEKVVHIIDGGFCDRSDRAISIESEKGFDFNELIMIQCGWHQKKRPQDNT